MPAKRYPVKLEGCQRDYLMALISSGTESARKLTRARILLKADEGEFGPAYPDKAIKEAVEVSLSTIRKAFVLEGLTAAQKKCSNASRPKSLMAKKKQSDRFSLFRNPEGFSRWTLRLLAEKMVELNHFSSISHEAIRQVLKKTTLDL